VTDRGTHEDREEEEEEILHFYLHLKCVYSVYRIFKVRRQEIKLTDNMMTQLFTIFFSIMYLFVLYLFILLGCYAFKSQTCYQII